MGSQLADGPLPPPPGGWDATASTTGTGGLPYGGANSYSSTGGHACGADSGCGTGVCPSDGKGEWIVNPDGSSASTSQSGCWGDSTESLVRYQYAGQGRGSYEKVPTYTYVGEGRGSFDKEAIGSDSRGCGQCACLVCVVASALALLAGLVALQAKDLGPAIAGAASGRKPTAEEQGGPSRASSVDCEALVRKLEQGLVAQQAEKLDWCCTNQQTGCSHRSTTSEPFDCKAGFASWHSSWPTSKRVYCCHMYARGCQADDHAAYDCQAGFDNWKAGWSDDKQRYCCRTAQRGCGGTTTTEPYDCASGFDFWKTAWSDDKAVWCCRTYRRGCTHNG